MKILITGGAGFIGSHLCEKYVNDGFNVICFDNMLNGNLFNIRSLLNKNNFKLILGDIRDVNALESVMHNVDVVFHLASQIHVDRSIIDPRMTYDINVIGTLNVLEVSRRFDVWKIINTSTSEVYGSAQYSPMNEEHPLFAPHPYGASKIASDRMGRAYIETYGMNIVNIRPFNTYGSRQRDTGYGGVISIFIKRVLNNLPPIIYGDGNQTRDYMYVDDLVNAFDLLLKYEKNIITPVNIGTGKEVKIINLANMIIDYIGKQNILKPVFIDPRPCEVLRLICDNTKMYNLTGWKPKIEIEEGLKRFITWYQTYKSEEWTKQG